LFSRKDGYNLKVLIKAAGAGGWLDWRGCDEAVVDR
jgi:hypothetical protein